MKHALASKILYTEKEHAPSRVLSANQIRRRRRTSPLFLPLALCLSRYRSTAQRSGFVFTLPACTHTTTLCAPL
jgi:hypothetical protein